METKWQLHCMNSFIDGVIINDFENDTEPAQITGQKVIIFAGGAKSDSFIITRSN